MELKMIWLNPRRTMTDEKNMIPLNEEQRQLVESCLSGERIALVHRAIREHIVVNETIFGFGYDDLYQ